MDNIVMIPTGFIYPHPDNPRKDLGDLTELAESIRQNGIYQNLTVVLRAEPIKTSEDAKLAEAGVQVEEDLQLQKIKMNLIDNGYRATGGYTVIIGHRRLAAAKLAGLKMVPCAIADMLPRKQVETMLLENMQRADLTIMEQVRGFQLLLDFGDSVKEIAQKTGFSERTVRRRTEIARLDPEALDKAMKSRGRQLTLEDFDMLSRIDDINERNRLLDHIGTNGFRYMLENAEDKQENAKALPEVEKWLAEHKAINVQGEQYVWRDYARVDGAGWQGCPLRDFKAKEKNLLKGVGNEQLYYVISDTGNLSLYHKKAGTPAEDDKKPKRSAAEIKREKQMNAAWEYLIEQSRITYKLRSEFINKLKVTKNNIQIIFEGAFMWSIIDSLCGCYDDRTIKTLFGISDENLEEWDNEEIAVAAIENIGKKDVTENLAKIVYGLFGDSEEKMCSANVWRGQWPKYEQDAEIIAMYKWLEYLGYEISEVERGLVQGTDVNYHLGDAEKEAAK